MPLTSCAMTGCAPCPAGTYAPVAALSACTACAAGGQSQAGTSACAPSSGCMGPALQLWDGAAPTYANLGANQLTSR